MGPSIKSWSRRARPSQCTMKPVHKDESAPYHNSMECSGHTISGRAGAVWRCSGSSSAPLLRSSSQEACSLHAHDGHQLSVIICEAHSARHTIAILSTFEGREVLCGPYEDIMQRQRRPHHDVGMTAAASPMPSSATTFAEVLTLLKLHAKVVSPKKNITEENITEEKNYRRKKSPKKKIPCASFLCIP